MRAAILSSEKKKKKKEEVWPKLVAAYRSAATQRKTDRDIPVVRLSPTPDRG